MLARTTLRTLIAAALACNAAISASAQNPDTAEDTDSLSQSLYEVTVTAQRPLIKKEIDRIGYDVQADQDSKTATLSDMLRKVPLVTVQPDGTILVNGSSNYKIYRNGRPSNAFTQNSKELFKALPASSIKKIEVITDPGAREDAEGVGAILNIVTMSNSGTRGATGSVGTRANSLEGYPTTYFANITAQLNKLTVSPYGGYASGKKQMDSNSSSAFTFADNDNKLSTTTSQHGRYGFAWWGLDASFDIDSLNLLSVEYSGMAQNVKSFSDRATTLASPDGSPIYSFIADERSPKFRYLNHSAAVNLQHSTHRKGETITLSYQYSGNSQSQNSLTHYTYRLNFPEPYSGIISQSRNTFNENTLQLDWSRPYSRIHTLDIGSKYIHRRSHGRSDINYIDLNQQYTNFIHTTQVGAIYADYRAKINPFTLRAGLRYEYSRLAGHYLSGNEADFASNLNDWVPNAAVAWTPTDASSWKLSYAMRINRPGIDYLNPAVTTTPTYWNAGNPNLSSASYHSLTANYTLTLPKVNIDSRLTYSTSNNGIAAVKWVEGNRLFSTYANVGKTHSLGISAFIQWTITDKTSLMLNASATHNHFANPDRLTGANLTNQGWSSWGYMQLTQRLPWKLRATLSLFYWGGGVENAYTKISAHALDGLHHSIALERSFLPDDRLTIRLEANNPFGPNNTTYLFTSSNSGLNGQTSQTNRHNTNASLTLSYRFGSLKAFVKKTKGITNDDMQGGSSGNSTASTSQNSPAR